MEETAEQRSTFYADQLYIYYDSCSVLLNICRKFIVCLELLLICTLLIHTWTSLANMSRNDTCYNCVYIQHTYGLTCYHCVYIQHTYGHLSVEVIFLFKMSVTTSNKIVIVYLYSLQEQYHPRVSAKKSNQTHC